MKRGRGRIEKDVWDYERRHRQHQIPLESHVPLYPGELHHAVPMPPDPQYERPVDHVQGRPQEAFGVVQGQEAPAHRAYWGDRRRRHPPVKFSRQEVPYHDSLQQDFRSVDKISPADFPRHYQDDMTYHHYRDHGSGSEDQKSSIRASDSDRLHRNPKYREPAYLPSGHNDERQYYSSRDRSPGRSGDTITRHDHLRDLYSFRRREGRPDWDGSGGKRDQAGYPVRRHGFEQEFGVNDDHMQDSVRSHNGDRSSVPSRDSGRDHRDRLPRHLNRPVVWDSVTRSNDRARDQENSMRTHDGAMDWHHSERSFDKGSGWDDSVRRHDHTKSFQGPHQPAADTVPSHDFEQDPAHAEDWDASVHNYNSGNVRDRSDRYVDRAAKRQNTARGFDGPPAANLADLFSAEELHDLDTFASAVSKMPPARPEASPRLASKGGPEQERCRYQDIPRSPHPSSSNDAWRHRKHESVEHSNVFPQQAFKRKWSSDFGPVPVESKPSAPKQARPPPSLLELNLDITDLTKPPDLEGLFDDDEDGRPTKRKKDIAELNSRTMDQKLQYFIGLVRSSPVIGNNDADIINQVLMSSGLEWKLKFRKDDVSLAGLGSISIFTLALDNIVLACGVGYRKTALKRKCYALALQRLRSMDAREILMLEFVGLDRIGKMVEEAKKSVRKPVKLGWESFIDALNDLEPVTIDVISRIERAMVNSKCGMERMFTITRDVKKGRKSFTGSLLIGGILQGQSTSFIIKECKIMAYEMAYSRFMYLELPDILKGVTPLSETDDEITDANISITPVSTLENSRRVERFMEKVKTFALKENATSRLTKAGHILEIPIITVHRMVDVALPRPPSFVCEVFLGDILIGMSQSEDKVKGEVRDKVKIKDKVKDQAFNQALQHVLTSSAQALLTETSRLKPEVLDTPSVMEMSVKGENKRLESCAEEMARYYGRILEAPKDWRSQMVVVETQECNRFIRKGCSTAILRNSAVMSGVVMSYVLSSVHDLHICLVKLQGEVMGMAKGYDWKEVKILAAADALFKLYETQPVLKVFKRTPSPPDNWVTKEQLMKKIETMDPSEFDEEKNQQTYKFIQKHILPKGDEITELKEEIQMFPRLCIAAYRLLRELMERGDCLEEVYFAPEVFRVGQTGVGLCTSNGGRLTVNRHRKNDSYCSVILRVGVHEILAKLKERGVTETSYFELVQDKSDFPHHADIAKEVEESLTLPKVRPKNDPAKDPTQPLSGNTDSSSPSSLPTTSDQQTAGRETMIVSTQVAPSMPPRDSVNLQSRERQAVMAYLAKALSQAGVVHAGLIGDEKIAK